MYRRLSILLTILFFIFPVYAWNTYTSTTNFLSYISNNEENSFSSFSLKLYHKINDHDINFDAFKYGLKGFLKLQNENSLNNSKYLTIIDMSVSANTERLFIINMETVTENERFC